MSLVDENVAVIKAAALTMLQWINNVLINFQINYLPLHPHFAF